MNTLLRAVLFFSICLGLVLPAQGQANREEIKNKVDAIVAQAYKEASARFPCRLRTSGKMNMGRINDLENCVNPAHDRVNWESHAAALRKIRDEERISHEALTAIVETALTEQMLSYDKVFSVNRKEEATALLPISNSLLKFLPEKSLVDLTVYRKNGELLGTFIGAYPFDRGGGLTYMTEYRMMNFQYTDLRGDAQAPTETFLRDSYGVPWRDVWFQPGFRLPSNRLLYWR